MRSSLCASYPPFLPHADLPALPPACTTAARRPRVGRRRAGARPSEAQGCERWWRPEVWGKLASVVPGSPHTAAAATAAARRLASPPRRLTRQKCAATRCLPSSGSSPPCPLLVPLLPHTRRSACRRMRRTQSSTATGSLWRECELLLPPCGREPRLAAGVLPGAAAPPPRAAPGCNAHRPVPPLTTQLLPLLPLPRLTPCALPLRVPPASRRYALGDCCANPETPLPPLAQARPAAARPGGAGAAGWAPLAAASRAPACWRVRFGDGAR